MKIGYVRVSSKDQNLDRQIEQLKKEKCEKILTEKESGSHDNLKNRKTINEILRYIRSGDEIVVSSLDRLSQSNDDIEHIMEQIRDNGATLTILNLPTFKGIEDQNLRKLLNSLVIDIFSYQAESERKMIKERQAEGIKLAKARGIYKGKVPEYSSTARNPQKRTIYFAIKSDIEAGDYSIKKLMAKYGVSRYVVRRIRNEIK